MFTWLAIDNCYENISESEVARSRTATLFSLIEETLNFPNFQMNFDSKNIVRNKIIHFILESICK